MLEKLTLKLPEDATFIQRARRNVLTCMGIFLGLYGGVFQIKQYVENEHNTNNPSDFRRELSEEDRITICGFREDIEENRALKNQIKKTCDVAKKTGLLKDDEQLKLHVLPSRLLNNDAITQIRIVIEKILNPPPIRASLNDNDEYDDNDDVIYLYPDPKNGYDSVEKASLYILHELIHRNANNNLQLQEDWKECAKLDDGSLPYTHDKKTKSVWYYNYEPDKNGPEEDYFAQGVIHHKALECVHEDIAFTVSEALENPMKFLGLLFGKKSDNTPPNKRISDKIALSIENGLIPVEFMETMELMKEFLSCNELIGENDDKQTDKQIRIVMQQIENFNQRYPDSIYRTRLNRRYAALLLIYADGHKDNHTKKTYYRECMHTITTELKKKPVDSIQIISLAGTWRIAGTRIRIPKMKHLHNKAKQMLEADQISEAAYFMEEQLLDLDPSSKQSPTELAGGPRN